MRLGGRLSAAIEVLEAVETDRRPVSLVLKEWGHKNRFAGSADRAAIGNLVHDALRHRRMLAAHMRSPSSRAAILAAVHVLPGYLEGGVVDLDGDPHAPPPLSPDENIALQSGPKRPMEPSEAASIPDWLWPSMERVFGSAVLSELEALAQRAPLDLRVNALRSKASKVDKALARHKPAKDPAFPNLRRVPAAEGFGRAPHIAMEEAYQKGWIEVQDAGSQLSAELGISGGKVKTVLDLCTGAGGKALALASLLGGKGQIFAHDIDRKRMADLWPRVRRSGAHNIQAIDPDELSEHEIAETGVDCVFVDAPCTGTGTWRRKPDSKWRVTNSALLKRIAEQDDVLKTAERFVKPGGRLVYVTCSLLAEENEDRLVGFLARQQDFQPASAGDMLQSLSRKTKPRGLPSIPTAGYRSGELGLRLTPHTSSTDGFFVALLTRDGGS
ncbi:MAG: RsmB/NOP family class I SAM-dependent RNA methyltransferase [Pseudomonadota bacterium]